MTWAEVGGKVAETGKFIIVKLLSARLLVTLGVTATLCWSVGKSLDMVMASAKDEKTFALVKDVVMYMLGAFTTVVTMSVNSYFNRSDRWKENLPENGENRGGTK
jgi:hypothetical protein